MPLICLKKHPLLLLLFFLVLTIPLLTACTNYPLHINAHSDAVLNLDQHNRSLPITVRIYQLTDDHLLQQANFYQLWTKPQQTLGDTLISQQDIILTPNEKKTLFLHRKKDARFVAAIAIFRKPSLNDWRVCKTLPPRIPYMPTKMTLHLVNNRIYLK